jgi:hypothetical protein
MAKIHLAETNLGENNPAGFGGEGSRTFLGHTCYSGQSLKAEPFPNLGERGSLWIGET